MSTNGELPDLEGRTPEELLAYQTELEESLLAEGVDLERFRGGEVDVAPIQKRIDDLTKELNRVKDTIFPPDESEF